MSRPLQQDTIIALTLLAEKNSTNKAELELIQTELQHRTTQAAAKLRHRVEDWIKECDGGTSDVPKAEATAEAQQEPTERDTANQQAREWTYEAVAKLRAKLIDLSRRSPLIAFKHTSRSASQLRFVDERPDLLFDKLNVASMGFEPLPGEEQTPKDEQTPEFGIAYERARLTDTEFLAVTENLGDAEDDVRAWQDAERGLRSRVRAQLGLSKLDYGKVIDVAALAKAHGFDTSYDLKQSDDGDVSAHHEDDEIRVLLTRKELDRRLKTIDDRAKNHLRETGHHTLHLAFGFVQWFEDDVSDIVSHAPLLLLPVKLAKDESRAKKDYRLSIWEGGLEVNVALIEKAREHWGLQLPALRNEESPESYFIRAKAVLAQGRRLSLRTFITLSVMPPMVLWRDLDPEKWPPDAFSEHRLLPGLVGASEITGVDGDDTLIDIDDPAHEARIPALITDADASQHRAIMDMAAGRDMAIEGPPGTGKSQTITNMIATALSQGKRVLFVAEKQAALRVVSDRLRASGFGPLLLELHGDKASRSDVYAGVRERLEYSYRDDDRVLNDKRAELQRHRNLLRRYLSLVRAPLGKMGSTAHALAWREIRLRKLFTREQTALMETRWSPTAIEELDFATLQENRSLLAQFSKALIAIDKAAGGRRTRWELAERLDPFNQTKALDAAAAAGHSADAMAIIFERYLELGVTLPSPNDDAISAASSQLSLLAPFSSDDELIVKAAIHHLLACQELLKAQSEWRLQSADIANDVTQPEEVTAEAAENLRDALAVDRCPANLIEVQAAQSLIEGFLVSLEATARDIERLADKLSVGLKTSSVKARDAALQIAQLGGQSPNFVALLSSDLLDGACEAVIISSAQEAAALLFELGELKFQVNADALLAEPRELDEIADTIESTGPLARIFSGEYKATWRRAVRFCEGATDRTQAAASLRRAASFIRARRTFKDESKARRLFPEMLWDGISSDFAQLRAARDLVSVAANRLATMDEVGVLKWWLGADLTERKVFSAGCERVSDLLTELIDADFIDLSLSNLGEACSERISSLKRITEAGKAIGLKTSALFNRTDGLTVANALLNLHEARRSFEALSSQPIFSWVGDIAISLQPLEDSLSELSALREIAGPIDVFELLKDSDAPAALLKSICDDAADLSHAVQEWESSSDQLWNEAEIDTVSLCEDLSWQEAANELLELSNDRDGSSLAADLLKYRAALATKDLTPFAKAASAGDIPPEHLDDIYELLASAALLRSYLGSDGQELGRLGSLSLDAARQSFKKVDKELHKLEAGAIISRRLMDTPPVGVGYGRKSDFTELRLLENEIELTRPRTPLRDVVHRSGQALQVLKPVWMMSPTSIAQFIRAGSIKFDLLIIDEASQMRPEFSVSCILRADQFVVVGDANQLPPSDHFQVTSLDGGDEDNDTVGVEDNTESILDLANQRFRTKPRLKWHYRSQHESLIQFSNREFYDRDLVVFPSPMANDDALLGVKCFYAPSHFSDTVYESSINQREAELLIEQAFGLMQTHPERSIGIVAMNAKQTELIQNEFERLIVEEERVRKYVEAFAGTIDEFFIKNLENVQGDERDIILISTVYGPDKNGTVRQNFGLMNREVGWRRLNVLVTRAKMSCRLITSLRPDDVKVTEKSSKGVIAFKSYLTYAHGGAKYDDASGGETDSDFEIFVADAIRGGGYEVVYQVGVENFRIDLGIRHESCPIGFIAGIECDGAPYHSGLSVRDRDHIRQTILENLGWNIYRVWSTDWFADPARETAKLLSWLDAARARVAREMDKQQLPIEIIKPKKRDKAAPANPVPKNVLEAELPAIKTTVEQPQDPITGTEQREPRGRQLRSLGDFQTYEAIRGRLYEIWRDETLLGEVEVVRRATAAPRLFGDRAVTAQSEYEGRVDATGDTFRSFDLYAAMREVASRAKNDV